MVKGRGRLTAIDMLPDECEAIITWAAHELADRSRTQLDIYGEFKQKLIALQGELGLGFDIPSFSAFNRHAVRLSQMTRRLEQTREIAATIAAAITKGLGSRAPMPGQTAIIQLGVPGTYANPGTLPASSTPVQILGDIANQGAYVVSGGGPAAGGVGVLGLASGLLTTSGLTLQNTGAINHNLVSSNNSYIRCEYTTFLTSVTTSFALAFAAAGGNIRFDAGCIWQASAGYMWYASGGTITMGANQALASTPNFTVATVAADNGGQVLRGSAGVAFTGTGAFGTRYNATNNSVINMLFGGENFIPGNVAGTKANGGLYQ